MELRELKTKGKMIKLRKWSEIRTSKISDLIWIGWSYHRQSIHKNLLVDIGVINGSTKNYV